MGKVFTSVLNDRLNYFMESKNILKPNQKEFRENYNTSDHIFVLSSLIEYYKAKKEKLYNPFIDFQNAFHQVW